MRDKDGWELTRKQREKYLEGFKLLYGGRCSPPTGIVPPRVNLEDLGLTHEKPGASGTEPGPDLGQLTVAGSRVPRRTSKPKAVKEWREQAGIFQWTQTQATLRGYVMKFDNEGRRNVVQAAVARRMGLLAGVSDLFVARPMGKYSGLWIEVKQFRHYTKSERATESWKRQETFQERMKAVGFAAAFAFGKDQGIEIIKHYMRGQSLDGFNHLDLHFPPDRDGP